MNEVLKAIKNRRSIRRYLRKQINDEKLDMLLEAAVYAPTGHNDQPWHFTVIQKKELIDEMSIEIKNVMARSQVDWIAKMGKSERLHVFYRAPTVIIVCGKKEGATTPIIDCSAAVQNILLAAESLGIGSCWIGFAKFFFENPENLKKLEIPEGYKPYFAVSLGYNDSYDKAAPERNKNVVNYIK